MSIFGPRRDPKRHGILQWRADPGSNGGLQTVWRARTRRSPPRGDKCLNSRSCHGLTAVQLDARSEARAMVRRFLSGLSCAVLLIVACLAAAHAEKRVALVVGNNLYP